MYSKLIRRSMMKSGIAAVSLAALAGGASAANVTSLQMGFTDSGSHLCPRIATMKVWAHVDGPGVVNFVIRNSNGIKTGALPVNAVKGPAGNWMATLTREIKITTSVDTRYMAEVKGSSKVSNWVPLKEACLGKAPQTTGYKKVGRHISELNKDKDDGKPIPQGGGKPLPQGGGKPLPSGHGKPSGGGKPVSQCSNQRITADRHLAATRAGGITTAWLAWEASVRKLMGKKYSNYHNSKDRKVDCKWQGMFKCSVSARPCAA